MFELRHELLKMVQNNVEAYGIAHKFVSDDKDKLEVFKFAFIESQQASANDVSAQTTMAVGKSIERWAALSPEDSSQTE